MPNFFYIFHGLVSEKVLLRPAKRDAEHLTLFKFVYCNPTTPIFDSKLLTTLYNCITIYTAHCVLLFCGTENHKEMESGQK